MDYSQFILPEYPNYLIYPSGHIYSIKSKKYLQPRFDKDGYERFSIKNQLTNKLDTPKTHQLVAKKYLGHTKTNKLVVDHIDCNILNNGVHNLQLISPLANILKYYYKKINKNGLPACISYKSRIKKYIFKLKTTDFKFNIECDDLQSCIEKKNEIFNHIINGKID
mgnify:CR=1 FL=1|tara:strand:+ start:66 stop:563 length:498 start_codon:yes stop_codon:yes gene_type:complete